MFIESLIMKCCLMFILLNLMSITTCSRVGQLLFLLMQKSNQTMKAAATVTV